MVAGRPANTFKIINNENETVKTKPPKPWQVERKQKWLTEHENKSKHNTKISIDKTSLCTFIFLTILT